MKYVLIISYFIVFSLAISRWKFFRNSGISTPWLVFLFGLKIIACLVYGKLFLDFYGGGDPYKVYKAGLFIHSSLAHDPLIYLRLVFGPNGGFAEMPVYKYAFQTGYWDHAGFYNIARLHALFRLISFGYYSVHIIFMAFLMMIGSLHYFRLFTEVKGFGHWPVLIAVFMMPSLIFWTGGFHKDGFVYLGIGISLYHTWHFIKDRHWRHLAFLFIGLSIIGMVRPFQLGMVILPLFLMVLLQKNPGRVFWKFGLAYAGLFLLAIIIDRAVSDISLLQILVDKQHAFLAESGNSEFFVDSLEANLGSFLAFLPTAVVNGFFRPFPWDADGVMQFLPMLGIVFFWSFAGFAIYFRRRDFRWNPLTLFLLFYGVSNIILIGYLVSNSGTLVRYRAVSFNFLLIILVLITDWNRLLRKPETSG